MIQTDSPIHILSLKGLVGYRKAQALQYRLLEKRFRDEIADTFLFLEHKPVVTRGRGLQFTGKPQHQRHMPLPFHLPSHIEFCETERGGDLTFHGPGQLVIYPILKLDGSRVQPKHDINAYLRALELWIFELLQSYGLHAQRKQDATGVWIGDQKVASIGIAVRKWITYHGIAINVMNDLKDFSYFSPCGFQPEVMTRLSDLLKRNEWPNWRSEVEASLIQLLESRSQVVQSVTLDEAFTAFDVEDARIPSALLNYPETHPTLNS